MSLLATMKEKPAVGIGFVLIVIAAVIVINVSRRPGASGVDGQRWFYDLTNGDLVTAAVQARDIATLPNGNEAVQAHVFSCGDCGDGASRFVGYVSRFAAQEPQADNPTMPPGQQHAMPVQLVAMADDHTNLRWVNMQSPQGMQIVNVRQRSDCPDKLTECTPGQ